MPITVVDLCNVSIFCISPVKVLCRITRNGPDGEPGELKACEACARKLEAMQATHDFRMESRPLTPDLTVN